MATSTQRRPGPPFRRALAVLLGATLGLIALEGVMQVVGYVLWRDIESGRLAEARTGATTILCVGDSFTFGVGASDRSCAYPGVLAAALDAAEPGRFGVVRRGRPGADSGDVLRALGRQLATFRPRLVYLLVGTNDRWSVGDDVVAEVPASDPADATGFPLRLRTLALARRIVTALTRDDVAAPGARLPDVLCGVWHSETVEVVFDPDGHLRFGDIESRWRVVGGALRVGPDAGSESELSWRVNGQALVLEGGALVGGRLTLLRGPAPEADPIGRARSALRQNRVDDARRWLAAAEAGTESLALTVELDARTGRTAAVERGLAALRSRARHDAAAEAALAVALLAVGHAEEGVAVATECLLREPRGIPLWKALTDLPKRDPEWLQPVLDVLDLAIEQVDTDRAFVAQLWIMRGMLREGYAGDYAGALADALRAGAVRGDFAHAVLAPRGRPERYGDEVVAAARSRLSLSPEQARTVDEVLHRARSEARSVPARLERHLRRCGELCRRHGAELAVLTYPEPTPLDGAIRRGAAAGASGLLDLRPVFVEALRTRDRSELFAPDGHCSDGGYELIARAVLADLRSRTR